jgi:hypothetical protein
VTEDNCRKALKVAGIPPTGCRLDMPTRIDDEQPRPGDEERLGAQLLIHFLFAHLPATYHSAAAGKSSGTEGEFALI